jgi:iron complex outermembrane recepter protein
MGRVLRHPLHAKTDGGVPSLALSCLCVLLLGRTALAQDPADAEPRAPEAEAPPPPAPPDAPPPATPEAPAPPEAPPPPAPPPQAAAPEAQPPEAAPEAPPAEAEADAEANLGVAEGDIATVTVVGSRIKRRSIATAAPVSVIDGEDMLAVGRPSVADVLQRLPSSANAINLQFNNGGNGSARVNLRSLGANRTLVLVNGRRFVPGGDGANSAVDLNVIPSSIIDRIEVLKDGGSAVYGSDAIAGVVNIITKKDFTGVEANAYDSITQRGDGRVFQVDLTAGVGSDDGRSNMVFSVQFLDQQPIFAGERDFSRVQRLFDFEAFDAAGRPNGKVTPFLGEVGSSAVPGGRLFDRTGAPGNAAWDALNCQRSTCQNGSERAGDVGQGWRLSRGDEDLYNFQPENYLSTPYQRLSLYALGRHRFSDYLGLFFEGSFTRRESRVLLAPEPFQTALEGLTVSAQNRYNPFGRDFDDVRRRMVEAGNRIFSSEGTTGRVVVGLEGDLPGVLAGWSWEAYLNYGRTDTITLGTGRLNRTRLGLALGPDSGCTGNCVPLDLFSGPGGITQQMVDYISYVGVDRGFSQQHVASASASGPLFYLWAEDPVAASLGYEYRREKGADIPDPLTASGDSTGNKRELTAGSYDMSAVYAEIVAPLVSSRPGVESLELSAAARLTTFANSLTYKLGLRYNPTNWFAVRGTVTTAFRTPSVGELYQGQADSVPNVSDPCSTLRGNLDNPTVAANCAADGYPGGVPDDSVQLLSRIGGSPDLEPETADTFTAGLVLEDQLVKGLTASIDYYKIEIDHAIESVGAGIILASCYQQDAGNRRFCDRIQRDGSGFVQRIIDLDSNVGGFRAEGIDLGLKYRAPGFGFGRLSAGIDGTLLLDLTQIQADGFEQSYVNNYDQAASADGGVNPRYRLSAFLRWALDPFDAGVNFRYLPSFDECDGGACKVESVERPIQRTVDDYFYMDLYAGVKLQSSFGATSVTVGVNNVTDAIPPYIANGFLAESDAATYDYAGRSFYLRLTQEL